MAFFDLIDMGDVMGRGGNQKTKKTSTSSGKSTNRGSNVSQKRFTPNKKAGGTTKAYTPFSGIQASMGGSSKMEESGKQTANATAGAGSSYASKMQQAQASMRKGGGISGTQTGGTTQQKAGVQLANVGGLSGTQLNKQNFGSAPSSGTVNPNGGRQIAKPNDVGMTSTLPGGSNTTNPNAGQRQLAVPNDMGATSVLNNQSSGGNSRANVGGGVTTTPDTRTDTTGNSNTATTDNGYEKVVMGDQTQGQTSNTDTTVPAGGDTGGNQGGPVDYEYSQNVSNASQGVESAMTGLGDLTNELMGMSAEHAAALGAQYEQMVNMLDQLEAQITGQIRGQMNADDPQMMAAIGLIKEEATRMRDGVMEELNAKGILQSGVYAKSLNELATGEMNEINQFVSGRFGDLQNQLNSAVMNIAGLRMNALSSHQGNQNQLMGKNFDAQMSLGAKGVDMMNQNTMLDKQLGSQYDIAKMNDDTKRWQTDQTTQNSTANAQIAANASMYGSDKSYQASRYSADSNLAGNMYQADSNYASNKYQADSNLAGNMYQTDASERMNTSNNASQMAQASWQYGVDASGNSLASREYGDARSDMNKGNARELAAETLANVKSGAMNYDGAMRTVNSLYGQGSQEANYVSSVLQSNGYKPHIDAVSGAAPSYTPASSTYTGYDGTYGSMPSSNAGARNLYTPYYSNNYRP